LIRRQGYGLLKNQFYWRGPLRTDRHYKFFSGPQRASVVNFCPYHHNDYAARSQLSKTQATAEQVFMPGVLQVMLIDGIINYALHIALIVSNLHLQAEWNVSHSVNSRLGCRRRPDGLPAWKTAAYLISLTPHSWRTHYPHTFSESKGAVIRKKDVLNRKQSELTWQFQVTSTLDRELNIGCSASSASSLPVKMIPKFCWVRIPT
tara:strand:+ start:295 stop:909 length:615 start_codon:yes stop_codon:yes gene_type:complete